MSTREMQDLDLLRIPITPLDADLGPTIEPTTDAPEEEVTELSVPTFGPAPEAGPRTERGRSARVQKSEPSPRWVEKYAVDDLGYPLEQIPVDVRQLRKDLQDTTGRVVDSSDLVNFLIDSPATDLNWGFFADSAREARIPDETILSIMTGAEERNLKSMSSGFFRGMAPSLAGTYAGIPAFKAGFAAGVPLAPAAGPMAPAVPLATGLAAGAVSFITTAYLTDAAVNSIFGPPEDMTPEGTEAFAGAQSAGAMVGALPMLYNMPRNVNPMYDNIISRTAVRIGQKVAERPLMAAVATIPETIGVGAGGYFAQRMYPENPWARMLMEFGGGVSPTAVRHVGGNVLDMLGSARTLVDSNSAQTNAGQRLFQVFEQNLVDKEALRKMSAAERADFLDDFLNRLSPEKKAAILEETGGAIDASISLGAREILIDTLQNVATTFQSNPTTAQAVPLLAGLERRLGTANAEFQNQVAARAEQNVDLLRNFSRILFEEGSRVGDQNVLAAAAMARQGYFEAILVDNIAQAESRAAKAATAILSDPNLSVAEQNESIGRMIRNISNETLTAARGQERQLWQQIPQNLEGEVGLHLVYDRLRADGRLLPEENFPSLIEDMFNPRRGVRRPQELDDGTIVEPVMSVGELLTFRSRMLSNARQAQAQRNFDDADIFGHFAEEALDEITRLAQQQGGESVLASVDAARSFSKSLNDTFSRAFAGDVLATNRQGALRVPAELLVARVNQSGAASAHRRVTELTDAVNFLHNQGIQTDALDAARLSGDLNDVVRGLVEVNARRFIDPATGRVNPVRLQTFMKENDRLFDMLPQEARDVFTDAYKLEFLAAEARAGATPAKESLRQRDAFGLLLTMKDDAVVPRYDNIALTINKALAPTEGNQPIRNLQELARLAKEGVPDPAMPGGFLITPEDAKQGLRRAVLDYAESQALKQDGTIDFIAYERALFQSLDKTDRSIMSVLGPNGQKIFSADDMKNVRQILEEGSTLQMGLMDPKKVQQALEDPNSELSILVGRMAGGKLGGMFANLVNDPASLLFRAAGSTYVVNTMRRLPMHKSQEALKLLMLDPAYAAEALKDIKPKAKADPMAGERGLAFLKHMFFGQRTLAVTSEAATEFDRFFQPEEPLSPLPLERRARSVLETWTPGQPVPQNPIVPESQQQMPQQPQQPVEPMPMNFDRFLPPQEEGAEEPGITGSLGGGMTPDQGAAMLFPNDPSLQIAAQQQQAQGFAAGGEVARPNSPFSLSPQERGTGTDKAAGSSLKNPYIATEDELDAFRQVTEGRDPEEVRRLEDEIRSMLAQQGYDGVAPQRRQTDMTHYSAQPNVGGWGQQHRDYWARVGSGEIAREGLERMADAFSDPTNPEAQREIFEMFGPGVLGTTAYHGSPYLFRALDPSRAGTGEGIQAYGYGAGYTSVERPFAETYRVKVSSLKKGQSELVNESTVDGRPINWDNPEEVAGFELARFAGNRQAAAEFHEKTFKGGADNATVALLRSDAPLPKVDLPGFIYKGDIPDEIVPLFLHWNKPLKEQPEPVRKLLESENANLQALVDRKNFIRDRLREKNPRFADRPRVTVEDLTGEELYRGLFPDARTERIATERFNSLGIRGVRYIDPGSKRVGKEVENYVVFRPEDFKIEEINDVPLDFWLNKMKDVK